MIKAEEATAATAMTGTTVKASKGLSELEPKIKILYEADDKVTITLSIGNKSFSDSFAGPAKAWYCQFLMRAAKEILYG